MRATRLLAPTLKEDPQDAEVVSHTLMLRAGLIRRLAAGLYTWLPLGVRVLHRIERLIREEMNRAGAQELLMPVVQPGDLWVESGRWEKYDKNLLRFSDRHGRAFCLGPTHEEVITDLFRREVHSYRQLPINLYQVQTKFRDEIRPRFGVMRAREFVMKDGYSFHLDQASFDETYAAMFAAYERILSRLELDFRAVLADTGDIGGSNSHEFQVLAGAGEDRIAFSDASDYAANVEKAEALAPGCDRAEPTQALVKVATPEQRSIGEVAEFLGVSPARTVKTLLVEGDEAPVALVLRGDHELNEIKASHLPGVATPFAFADEAAIRKATGSPPGSIGPIGIGLTTYVDRSAAVLSDFVCGANEEGHHYSGANWNRDAPLPPDKIADLRNVVAGDPSPDGRGVLAIKRGIEVGHIFQLDTIYSEALGVRVLDAHGNNRMPIMGCYGMGVTRLVAAIIEQRHDDGGIVWPAAAAPFQVHLLALNYESSAGVKATAERLYAACQAAGIEVLLDDRDERPGVKFAEADLLGLPHRVTIGDRHLKNGQVEHRVRSATDTELIDVDRIVAELKARIDGS